LDFKPTFKQSRFADINLYLPTNLIPPTTILTFPSQTQQITNHAQCHSRNEAEEDFSSSKFRQKGKANKACDRVDGERKGFSKKDFLPERQV